MNAVSRSYVLGRVACGVLWGVAGVAVGFGIGGPLGVLVLLLGIPGIVDAYSLSLVAVTRG